MHRTLPAAGAALAAAGLLVAAFAGPGASAAVARHATAADPSLRYLYGQQRADGSIDGSVGETADTIIGAADNGYDPATLRSAGGVTAIDFLAGRVAAGKVTTAGALAKVVLAWLAAGRPGTLDGATLVAKLNTAASAGGFLQPDGLFFANGEAFQPSTYTQALAVLADVAAGRSLPANAAGWLTCAQRGDGGFGGSITNKDAQGNVLAAPPASGCGDTASDSNDTGIALQALAAAGTTGGFPAARSYLLSVQDADGGFNGGYGATASDPDSDATVVQGLVAIGEDPRGAAWTKSGRTPLTNLQTFVDPGGNGGYDFAIGDPSTETFTTTEIPAALALKRYGAPAPFTSGVSPFAAPATPTPTAAASAAPSATAATPSVTGVAVAPPSTGAGALPSTWLGAVLAGAGAAIVAAAAARSGRRRR